jgi:hypothetical protein
MAIFILFFTTKTKGFESFDLIFPTVTVLTRSLIIAIRYSFMSKSRYSLMKRNNPMEWISSDLIAVNWDRISFNSLNLELKSSVYRLKVEDDDFDFTFLNPLPLEFHRKLSNSNYYEEKNLTMKEVVKEITTLRKHLSKVNISPNTPQTDQNGIKLSSTQRVESQKEDDNLRVILILISRMTIRRIFHQTQKTK